MSPRILNHLQRIEIEDAHGGQRRRDLTMGLERLSPGPGRLGKGINALKQYLPRSKFRLFTGYTIAMPPTGPPNDHLVRWSMIALMEDQAFYVWKSTQPLISEQDWYDFQSRYLVSHAPLDLEKLPKVRIVDILKRALVEKRVDAVRPSALF